MAAAGNTVHVRNVNEYEDLLAEWADLESGLGIVLGHPDSVQQFASRIGQYDRWMQALLARDADVGLYLLFQLAGHSPVGYSASHALVCAVLCHQTAAELTLPRGERDSLVGAALTMNISMTALQDVLANQAEKPSAEQQDQIRTHPLRSAMLLSRLGVIDDDWLEIVSQHHDENPAKPNDATQERVAKLAQILRLVDRYAAMISPRLSRAGRTATESARSIMANAEQADALGHALVRTVGLCPPGTFVRMDNNELAVVVRRSGEANLPFVAIVGKATGELLPIPHLHGTASGPPGIRTALPATTVRAQLNHHLVLRLGALARAQ